MGGFRTRQRGLFDATAATMMLLAMTGLGGVTGAQAQPATGLPMASQLPVSQQRADATRAWTEFCTRLPEECTVDPAEVDTINLTPTAWRMLVDTNARVNASIKPVTDQDHWGVEDRWDYPEDGAGDCEDIQLLKRRLLSEGGLPRRALRMTVVIDSFQAGHAVLLVRTDRGDFVLDNMTNAVLPWHETGYDFVKREGDGSAWVQLSPRSPPRATAEPGGKPASSQHVEAPSR
jgi:predicted transglutaminase-like cysteine proteinase